MKNTTAYVMSVAEFEDMLTRNRQYTAKAQRFIHYATDNHGMSFTFRALAKSTPIKITCQDNNLLRVEIEN